MEDASDFVRGVFLAEAYATRSAEHLAKAIDGEVPSELGKAGAVHDLSMIALELRSIVSALREYVDRAARDE